MATSDKPNVIFIVNHDVSRDWFGCYGNPIHTPNLDKLAQSGFIFDRHYCQYPLCGPSRANLYSGCRPDTTNLFANVEFYPGFRERVGKGSATLPEHFRTHGYWTQSLTNVMGELSGKTVDDSRKPAHDEPSWSAERWSPPPRELPSWLPKQGPASAQLNLYATDASHAVIRRRMQALRMQGKDPEMHSKLCMGPIVEMADVPDNAYQTGQTTDRMVQYLEEYASRPDQPFFLTAGYLTGHSPWAAPKKYWDLYEPENLVLPKTSSLPEGVSPFAFYRGCEPAKGYTQDGYSKRWTATTEQLLEIRHGYFACISFFDAQIGRLLQALEDNSLRDNTIVMITSDHGHSIGEHGHWHKMTTYEPDHSVPLFLSVPGLDDGGQRIGSFTEHVDLYPTLSDLCGLPIPGHLEGTSFAPLLKNPDMPWKKAAFDQVRRFHPETDELVMGYSMRTERYRFTRWENLGQNRKVEARELYDYERDPLETANLIDDPEYASVLPELEAMMDAGWRGALPPVVN